MKLATLKSAGGEGAQRGRTGRDGILVVVDKRLERCRPVPEIAMTLQAALDDWDTLRPRLAEVYRQLNEEVGSGQPFDPARCHSPLPRAYQWADGSAYLNHVELVRKARGAEVPASFYSDPLMYQGGSDSFIGPRDPVRVYDEDWGIDFEAEVAVITGDVPMGATPAECDAAIKLVMLVNDISLRNLIPGELQKGFGFFQSKPASAFSPVCATPDELGAAWRDSKLSLPLLVDFNGRAFGCPNAGDDMRFSFAQLIAHAARTRDLVAGSIVGSGTVSNKQGGLYGSKVENGGVGFCCIAEVRMLETIEQGAPLMPFMRFGDRVRIDMVDEHGMSIFGSIDQTVAAATPGAR